MRSVLLNVTTSLDGFIAALDGGIDWILPPPTDIPEDYLALIDTVDAFVMGRVTYEVSLTLPGGMDLFVGKRVYVITSCTDLEPRDGVDFVHRDPVAFVASLKRQPGGTIWLFGGGQLATALSGAGLVDDYLIAIQPVLLGEGIALWQGGHKPQSLESVYTRQWSGGMVELRYRRAGA